jgi:hypothetical protein
MSVVSKQNEIQEFTRFVAARMSHSCLVEEMAQVELKKGPVSNPAHQMLPPWLEGQVNGARHVIPWRLTQDTRVHNAMDDKSIRLERQPPD